MNVLGSCHKQERLHHLLPRGPVEDSSKEDLRRLPRHPLSLPRYASRAKGNVHWGYDPDRRLEDRAGPDARSSPSRVGGGGQERPNVDDQGAQDQGHISCAQSV